MKKNNAGGIVVSLQEQEMLTDNLEIVRGFLALLCAVICGGEIAMLGNDDCFSALVTEMENKIENVSNFLEKKHQEVIA